MSTSNAEAHFGGEALDPADMLALADETERRAAAALNPDTRTLYVGWGVAWLVGYLAMWLAYRPDPVLSPTAAGWILGILIAVATVINIVSVARTRGVGGLSQQQGSRWGISWGVAWVGLFMIIGGLANVLPADSDIPGGFMVPILITFIIGALYLQGATFWPDSKMFPVGLWLMIVAGVAALSGWEWFNLVLAIGGGGAFLVAAALVPSPGREVTAR